MLFIASSLCELTLPAPSRCETRDMHARTLPNSPHPICHNTLYFATSSSSVSIGGNPGWFCHSAAKLSGGSNVCAFLLSIFDGGLTISQGFSYYITTRQFKTQFEKISSGRGRSLVVWMLDSKRGIPRQQPSSGNRTNRLLNKCFRGVDIIRINALLLSLSNPSQHRAYFAFSAPFL